MDVTSWQMRIDKSRKELQCGKDVRPEDDSLRRHGPMLKDHVNKKTSQTGISNSEHNTSFTDNQVQKTAVSLDLNHQEKRNINAEQKI